MKTRFHESLVDREHGSKLLHVGSLLAWAKKKNRHLNPTPPLDGYEFVQVECLVVDLARQSEDLTPAQAREIVLADPVHKNNPRFLKYPNDIDPVFCKWLLEGGAHVWWRSVLNSAIAAHELELLDFGSKLPIAAEPVQTTQTVAPEVTDGVSNAPVRARRDLLTPVIDAAQRESKDPFDAPAVFNLLCGMAGAKKGSLLGVSDEGIKWQDSSDETQFLTLKNLSDRLRRLKKKAR